VDRTVMILTGTDAIREVIAFPKTQKAACPMSGTPSEVNRDQLAELGVRIAVPPTAKATAQPGAET
jgi:aspartyl-tRNA synthetase